MHPRNFLILAALCSALAARAEATWQPLFNGKDLTGWDMWLAKPPPESTVPGLKRDEKGNYLEVIGLNRDPLKVFQVETVDGQPAIHVSGEGFGTITTSQTYTNFHLRMQIKWGERKWGYKAKAARDCGLLYYANGNLGFDHETWPRSIEFQIQEHDMGDLFAIATQITVPARQEAVTNRSPLFIYDPKGQPTLFVSKKPIGNRCCRIEDAEKPKGEWNTLDLICFNGNSIHIVNGKVEMRLQNAQRLDGPEPAPLTSGKICLQTEGAEVFYRNVEIQPIQSIPAEYAEP